MLGVIILLLHLGNLLEKVFILRFQVRLHALQLDTLGDELRNDLVGLGTLVVQLCLGGIQLFLGGFQVRLFRLQLSLGLGNRLGGLVQLLQAAIVRSGDFLNHAHAVQKV